MSTLFQNIHSVDQSVDAAKAAIVQEIERLSSGGIDAAPSLTLRQLTQLLSQIEMRSGGSELLFRDKLQAWAPLSPLYGTFSRLTGVGPSHWGTTYESLYIESANLPKLSYETDGLLFDRAWIRNRTSHTQLSLSHGHTVTLWWKPTVWPTDMAIIRAANGDGNAGSGIRVINGRLMLLAEILIETQYDWSWDGSGTTYIDHSTFVDIGDQLGIGDGEFNSTNFPANQWNMLAMKARSLEYYNQDYGSNQTRPVIDYWFNGTKLSIPHNVTGIQAGSWGGWTYPNCGDTGFVHPGYMPWSYGEPEMWDANTRAELAYRGYFCDWRSYDETFTEPKIADLYAAGPYLL